MVRATATHTTDPIGVDRDTAALLAADLAVLAAEPARYADYSRAVRREYAHLDDDQWRTGRTQVLRDVMSRQAIFDPRLGLAGWEARARANLAAELATLARGTDTTPGG